MRWYVEAHWIRWSEVRQIIIISLSYDLKLQSFNVQLKGSRASQEKIMAN